MGYRLLDDYDPRKDQKKKQQKNGALSAPRSGNSAKPSAVSGTSKPAAPAAAASRATQGTALGGSAITPVRLPKLQPTAPKLTRTTTAPIQKTAPVQPLKLPEIKAFGAGDYRAAGKAMERGAKTVAAGGLSAAGSAVEIAGQFTPTSGQQSMGQFSGFGDLGRAVRENREKGTSINESIRRQEGQRRERQKLNQQNIFTAADRLTEKGQRYEQEAKEGLGTVGQFLVDMGVTGTQMAGDALMNLVLPGSGLAMMGMRSYGQAAGEARRAGKSEQQQFLAGLKSAGIEMFTEKMFGAFAGIYGKAGADELVEKLVGKLAKNTTGQALLTWMINAAGEGVEEVTSDLLNPLADRLLQLDDGRGGIYSADDLAQWGYDFLLGTAMGILGGGTQLARGVRQGQAQAAEDAYYSDLRRNGLGSAAAAANARQASDAMGRIMPVRDGLRVPQLVDEQGRTYEERQAASAQRVANLVADIDALREAVDNGLHSPQLTTYEETGISKGEWNPAKEYGLTPDEESAIVSYKSGDSYSLNGNLASGVELTAYQRQLRDSIDSALEKLPVYDGTVYRHYNFDDFGGYEAMRAFLQGFRKDKGFDARSYWSASTVPNGDRSGGEYTVDMVIRSASSRSLSGFGLNTENEVLIPRNAVLFPISMEAVSPHKIRVIMREGAKNAEGTTADLLETGMRGLRESPPGRPNVRDLSGRNTGSVPVEISGAEGPGGQDPGLSGLRAGEGSGPLGQSGMVRPDRGGHGTETGVSGLRGPRLVDEQGRTYDERVLALESIEKEEPSSSATANTEQSPPLGHPSSSSFIRVQDLLRLVNSEYQKYVPRMANAEMNTVGAFTNNSQSLGGSAPAINSASGISIRTSDTNDNAAQELSRGVADIRSLADTTSAASGSSIPTSGGNVNGEKYSTGRGLDELADTDHSDYLDALARDENVFTSDAYTLADRLYDLQLRRAQQQEAPPERPAAQVAQEDLDELAGLFTDQGSFFSSREDRIRDTENMVTDHTIAVEKPGREKASEAWSYFYRKMVDAGHSVSKFAKAAGDPYLYQIYNQARASSSAGVSMITDAQTNVNAQKVGESLNGIFSPIRKKGEDYYRAFQIYLFDLHNTDRMSLSQNKETAVLEATAALNEFDANHPEMRTSTEAQLARMTESLDPEVAELAREKMRLLRNINRADAIKDKPVFSFDVTADVSRERARRALEQHPEFEEYRQQVRGYIDNLMQYRVDSGLMTQADADYLKRLYPNYVPTMRKGGDQAGTGRDRNAVRIGRTVGRAEGGTADLVPLHEALGRQTMKVVREGSKNRFGQRLLDDFMRVGENSPAARYVQEANEYEHEFTPDALDDMSREQLTRDKTLTVFKDGKLWELTVDDTMFDALKALSPDAAESNAVTRAVRTANNLFKALVTGYNPTFTIRNTVRDLQTAGLYTRDGAAFARNYPKALAEIKNNGRYWQMYKALGGSFSSVFDYNTGTVREPKGRTAKIMAKIEALNMAMEQAPRLAEFMGVVEKGGTSTENLADALYAAADVTVNFGRAGTLGKVLNANYVPFLNPGIQGFDKLIRLVTETKGGKEWAKLAIRAAALGVAPTLLNSLLYHDDEEWDELRDSDKDTNYLFKLGNGTWLKIPKGRELSLLGITADRIGDAIRDKDVDLIATINTMGSQVAPANPLTSNIASALFESDLFDPSSPGRTWYGGDIENQRLQSYAPGQRYDSSTDIFSKAVGGALGISPKKLNYVLDQYSGVIGDFLLPLLTPQAERDMFSKAFTVDAVTSNRLSGDFYDEADALTYAKNDGDKAAAVVSRFWSKQQSACSDLYKQIRQVEASSLSDREKQQKVRELKALVNGIQKNAMAMEETYRKAVEKNLRRGMDTDDAYRAANKDCFGAEYALQVYNKDVYEKAKNARSNGVSYDDYYTYYFGTRGFEKTDDTSVTTQKFEFLQNSGMDLTSQAEIYFADMASDKTLETQAQLEISSGITAEQFYQYKVASSGMTKKAEKMQAINSLDLTSVQKDAIYYAEGWAQSTIGQAPWRSGHFGGYSSTGSGGNPFTRARMGSNPFLRASGTVSTGGTAQNPFTKARAQNSGQPAQSNPFLQARWNG